MFPVYIGVRYLAIFFRQMIKNLEKGSEFNFNDYFRRYFIDDREKFELYFEISKELKGQFVAKNKGAVEGLPHNLTYIKL